MLTGSVRQSHTMRDADILRPLSNIYGNMFALHWKFFSSDLDHPLFLSNMFFQIPSENSFIHNSSLTQHAPILPATLAILPQLFQRLGLCCLQSLSPNLLWLHHSLHCSVLSNHPNSDGTLAHSAKAQDVLCCPPSSPQTLLMDRSSNNCWLQEKIFVLTEAGQKFISKLSFSDRKHHFSK